MEVNGYEGGDNGNLLEEVEKFWATTESESDCHLMDTGLSGETSTGKIGTLPLFFMVATFLRVTAGRMIWSLRYSCFPNYTFNKNFIF